MNKDKTEPDKARIDRILKRFRCLWKKYPNATFADVVAALEQAGFKTDEDLENVLDDVVLSSIADKITKPGPWPRPEPNLRERQDYWEHVGRKMAEENFWFYDW